MDSKIKKNEYLLILIVIYSMIIFAMNIFSTKPLSFGTSIIIMDAGTLLSWIPFAIGDILVEAYDKKTAEFVVKVTSVVSLLVLIIGYIITYIPTLPIYDEQSEHFRYVFNNGPRIIVASILAMYIGSIINVKLISRIKEGTKSKKETNSNIAVFVRAFIASLCGQLADNVLFQVLAFAPVGITLYELRWIDIWTTIVATTIWEMAIESIFVISFTNKIIKKISKVR